MEKLFSDMGSIELVMSLVIGINLALSLIAQLLDWLKNKTKSEADNKAADLVHKILDVLSKVVDWVSANKKH